MDSVDLRIFVGGLPLELTEQKLKEYFTRFGKLTSCQIIYEKNCSKLFAELEKSKGFGFITCGNQSTYDKILHRRHRMGSRIININGAFKEKKSNHLGKAERRRLFFKDVSPRVKDRKLTS